MYAVIEIRQWYGGQNDTVHLAEKIDSETERRQPAIFDSREQAEEFEDGLNSKNYCLSHNQSGGWYDTVEVLDDNTDYQGWLDNLDWDGCPSEDGSDYDANCAWAEQRAIYSGGSLPIQKPDTSNLVLVEMPTRN